MYALVISFVIALYLHIVGGRTFSQKKRARQERLSDIKKQLQVNAYCGEAPRRLLNSVDFRGFQLVLHVTGMEV